ncbi:MAG: hypothetical protein K9N55_01695 [Phycisphaerae bacterium]|nr:hypothetical protein [Phycisphaerae bacterium]
MGRQKQLIVPLEDSVVESLHLGTQAIRRLRSGMSQLGWCMMSLGQVCRIVATQDSELTTQGSVCFGMARGRAGKGIMAV